MGERKSLLRWLTLPADEPDTPQDFFAKLPVINTQRLILRKMTMRDASDVYRYARDKEVARHVLWEAHQSIWDTRGYIRYLLYLYRNGEPSS